MKPTVIPVPKEKGETKKPTVIPTNASSPSVLQPTRVSAPAEPEQKTQPTPTTIGKPELNQARKPTVISGGEAPTKEKEIAKAAPAPTRITQPPSAPAPPAAPPKATGPSVMPGGTKRVRPSVTLAELTAAIPATSLEAREQALEIILKTNLDLETERTVVLWGHELQRAYTELVTQCLTLSQSASLTQTNRDLGRILEILESVDLQKVFSSNGGLVAGFLAKRSNKIDSISELEKGVRELQEILNLLNKRLDDLLDLRGKLDIASGSITAISKKIEASAIAAEYLARYIKDHKSEKAALAQHFSDRGMSLTQTTAQIMGSASVVTMQVEQPLAIVKKVQDVALVLLPGFLSTIVTYMTLKQGNQKPSTTSVSQLGDQLQVLVNQLKG